MFKKFVMSLFVACLLIAAPKADAHSSIDNLRAAAEKGDVEAQFKLGFLYSRDADSQSQDYEEAAKWYRKAAEQGHYGAQFSLGSFYAKGLGVRQDYGEAVKLFGKAAVQGHPLAAVHLGILHYKGLGSSRNFEEAYFWLRLSASQDPHVVGYRDGAQQKLTPSQLAKAEKRLHEWRYKPAAREDAEGQYRLGLLYLRGRGDKLPADFSVARQWIQAAASQGHEKAQEVLQDDLLETIWVEENNKRQEQTALEKEMLLWVDAAVMDTMRFGYDNIWDHLKSSTRYFTVEGWVDFSNQINELQLVELLLRGQASVLILPWQFPEIIHRENLQDGRMRFTVDAVYGIKLYAGQLERDYTTKLFPLRISVETDSEHRGIPEDFMISRWSPGPDRPFIDVP